MPVLFGIERQVYYPKIKCRNKTQLVGQMVIEFRTQIPKIGSKKRYYLLNEDVQQLKISRDKFIDTLRVNHLLILAKHSYNITTNSHHRFRKCKNQLLDLQINRSEQVFFGGQTSLILNKEKTHVI
ncbi:hypothetical protein [Flavobacterium oreochromis]|uniref:hypothetical protein n=1 Tax=Flavobacterium oreochromis TaxID=2906078 RepID=UPI00385D7EFF